MYDVKTWNREDEIIPPEHLLTAEEQEVLAEILDGFYSYDAKAAERYQKELARNNSYGDWAAGRFRSSGRVSVTKECDAWNYHDESWTKIRGVDCG